MAVSIREALGEADEQLSLELYNAVLPDERVTLDEVRVWRTRADATGDWIANVDGDDVGSAVCAIQPQNPAAAYAIVTVLPRARRRGAGSALYRAISRFARAHGRELLETNVEVGDEASLAFAHRRGFVEQQREVRLELDVRSAPRLEPDTQLELVRLDERPELAEGAYDVVVESIPDIPGEEAWTPPPRERWTSTFGLPRRDAVLLALASGEVVGYSQLQPKDVLAVHGMTAVKRAWRRQGIARALKVAQIEWARAQGIELLRTANEQRNAAIQGLNERLGYVAAAGRVTLRGPLAETTR